MIYREHYLTQSWAADPDRRTDAGVPVEVEFATKPALAGAMITDAVVAGVPARWVTGDGQLGAVIGGAVIGAVLASRLTRAA